MMCSFVDMEPPVWTDPPFADARFFLFLAALILYSGASHLILSPFQAPSPIQDGRSCFFLASIRISERRFEPLLLKIALSSNSSSGRQATFCCNILIINKLQ